MFGLVSVAWAEGAMDAQEQELPDKFDLRAVDKDGDGKDVRCYVTPVRNQSPYGICWGFATTAAAETYVLAHQLSDDQDAWKTLNFSEKQLS